MLSSCKKTITNKMKEGRQLVQIKKKKLKELQYLKNYKIRIVKDLDYIDKETLKAKGATDSLYQPVVNAA